MHIPVDQLKEIHSCLSRLTPEVLGQCSDPERVLRNLQNVKFRKPSARSTERVELPSSLPALLTWISDLKIIEVPAELGIQFGVAWGLMRESVGQANLAYAH
jgi:hypothetical protein